MSLIEVIKLMGFDWWRSEINLNVRIQTEKGGLNCSLLRELCRTSVGIGLGLKPYISVNSSHSKCERRF